MTKQRSKSESVEYLKLIGKQLVKSQNQTNNINNGDLISPQEQKQLTNQNFQIRQGEKSKEYKKQIQIMEELIREKELVKNVINPKFKQPKERPKPIQGLKAQNLPSQENEINKGKKLESKILIQIPNEFLEKCQYYDKMFNNPHDNHPPSPKSAAVFLNAQEFKFRKVQNKQQTTIQAKILQQQSKEQIDLSQIEDQQRLDMEKRNIKLRLCKKKFINRFIQQTSKSTIEILNVNQNQDLDEHSVDENQTTEDYKINQNRKKRIKQQQYKELENSQLECLTEASELNLNEQLTQTLNQETLFIKNKKLLLK